MAQRTCSIEGCEKPAKCRGWCPTHYSRWQRHGDPLTVLREWTKTTEERFWSYVDKAGPDGCWLWTGTRKATGYGRFYVSPDRRDEAAHRFAYELLVGQIPDGLHVDHLCRVTRCVNPDHLEPVTQQENNRRQAAARTHCPNGHPYDEANTYVSKRTGRLCRICSRQKQARYKREGRGQYAGLPERKAARQAATQAKVERIAALRRQGLTFTEIGPRIGGSAQSVSQLIRRHGYDSGGHRRRGAA